jgi:hypothetical protein
MKSLKCLDTLKEGKERGMVEHQQHHKNNICEGREYKICIEIY